MTTDSAVSAVKA